jgi:hypothetical protein
MCHHSWQDGNFALSLLNYYRCVSLSLFLFADLPHYLSITPLPIYVSQVSGRSQCPTLAFLSLTSRRSLIFPQPVPPNISAQKPSGGSYPSPSRSLSLICTSQHMESYPKSAVFHSHLRSKPLSLLHTSCAYNVFFFHSLILFLFYLSSPRSVTHSETE